MIQKSDSPNTDFYHGTLHFNDEDSNYGTTGEIINDLTGGKGTYLDKKAVCIIMTNILLNVIWKFCLSIMIL
ncbi:hypothetical protein [Ehrlichia minasensis]|uniref:hypothetical protein n=1 Tax=Ehrlichia minasensis TaxID=1242993 RepID=UPI00101F32DC|nr:hypothetical protein [Ehrlichia minasensis]